MEIQHGEGFSKHGLPVLNDSDVLDDSTGKWLPRHNGVLEWVPNEREAG